MRILICFAEADLVLKEKFDKIELAAGSTRTFYPTIRELMGALTEDSPDICVVIDESFINEIRRLSKMYKFVKFVVFVTAKVDLAATSFSDYENVNSFIFDRSFSFEKICSNLYNKSIFGSENSELIDYFNDTPKERVFTLTHSTEKNVVVEQIELFIEENCSGVAKSVLQNIIARVSMIADELILNALYDANPRLRDELRSGNYALSNGEEVRVKIAISATMIGLSVKDYFGNLKRRNLLSSLDQNAVREKMSLRKSGGFGFRLSVGSSGQFIVKVEEKKYTEIMSLVYIFPSLIDYIKSPRAIFFVQKKPS